MYRTMLSFWMILLLTAKCTNAQGSINMADAMNTGYHCGLAMACCFGVLFCIVATSVFATNLYYRSKGITARYQRKQSLGLGARASVASHPHGGPPRKSANK